MSFILDNILEWKNRFVNNTFKSFEDMSLQRWIRIILIIGAYLLLRPYLLKGASNRQKRLMKQDAEDLGLNESGETNANDWRGGRARKGAATTATTTTGEDKGATGAKGKSK